MKQKYLLLGIVLVLMIPLLSACGGTTSKATQEQLFSNRVKEITQNHSELADYSMDHLFDAGNGTYSATANVAGKTIGAISICFKDDQLSEFTFSFSADGPSKKEYQQPIIASAMALDASLDYATADSIADSINDMLLFGGKPVEKNGYTYSGVWGQDDLIYVKIQK